MTSLRYSISPAASIASPLHTLAEVAARLTSCEAPAASLPAVIELAHAVLGGEALACWRNTSDGPVLAARSGHPFINEAELQAVRSDLTAGAAHVAVAPLTFGERRLGTLVLLRARALDADESLLLSTVANLLAPAFAHAEAASRLEDEIAARTKQMDEQRRLTDRVIDSLPVGLYVIDRDYRIQLWNRQRETGLQGVSREEAVGRTIFEILHRQPEQQLRSEFEEVVQSGRVQQFATESSAFGESRHYRITKVPMRLGDGEVTHIITVGEDITEWRNAQVRFAQTEKLAAVGQLAAGVMHEINNPLATIAACAESVDLTLDDLAVAGCAVPPSAREFLSIVDSEVHRCKRIIERLLQYSRPAAFAAEPVDVNTVVDQTLFLLKHHGRFKSFSVKSELATGAAPVVQGNAEQLIQVLMALLINAMDAMPEAGTIRIRVTHTGRPDNVLMEVQDEGAGIPRSELTRIFEPFYTTKAPGRGTGLGLSICYGIVTEHGGTIAVESRQGAGSIFRVTLPAARVA